MLSGEVDKFDNDEASGVVDTVQDTFSHTPLGQS